LILHHPELSGFTCGECQHYVYNIRTGARETYQSGSPDNVVPMQRNGMPPPCKLGEKCPKIGPEHEADMVLTLRNHLVHQEYLQRRIGGWWPVPDKVLARFLVLCDVAYRERDRIDQLAMAGVAT
jgi:hypothetical protein